MYRSNTCGELRLADKGRKVTLAGWVQKSRKLGGMTFIDLRDRYGVTQLVVEADAPAALVETATSLGREFVIQVEGEVVERQSKNPKMPTGEIEIRVGAIRILNKSVTPPFTIEEESDGGEDLRAKYRYLDLRRPPLQRALALRHRLPDLQADGSFKVLHAKAGDPLLIFRRGALTVALNPSDTPVKAELSGTPLFLIGTYEKGTLGPNSFIVLKE